MSAHEPQVVDSIQLSELPDYQFSGNDVTISNKQQFLAAYLEHGTITHAAAEVGLSRKTIHHWINTDPAFAEAFADTHEDCGDVLESSVYQRAFKSDLLAMFWLKAYRPRFRDKVTIDIDDLREQIRERVLGNPQLLDQARILQLPQIPSESENKQKD